MVDKAEEFCRTIDDLLATHPRKTLVVEPEVRELLRLAHLRREVGRRMAAIGASCRKHSWQQLEATLRVR